MNQELLVSAFSWRAEEDNAIQRLMSRGYSHTDVVTGASTRRQTRGRVLWQWDNRRCNRCGGSSWDGSDWIFLQKEGLLAYRKSTGNLGALERARRVEESAPQ